MMQNPNVTQITSDIRFSSFKHSFYTGWVIFHILLFLAISLFIHKSMFSYQYGMFFNQPDGFFTQINGVSQFIVYGSVMDMINPLGPNGILGVVHYLRFLAVFPFYFNWLFENPPVLDTLLLIVYLGPIFFVRFSDKSPNFLLPLIIYLPFFCSFRAILTMCAIAYLFVHLYSRENWGLVFVSAFIANLSSAVVLPWLAIVLIHINFKKVNRFLAIPLLSIMFVSIIFSLIAKFQFFILGSNGSSGPEVIFQALMEMFSRNTIWISYLNGNYARCLVYLVLMVMVIFIIIDSWRKVDLPKRLPMFFLPFLIMFFVEGLGPISSLFACFLYFVYFSGWPFLEIFSTRSIWLLNKKV